MKQLSIVLILMVAFGISFGQRKSKKDFIYLKTGTVMKGNLLAEDDQKIRFQSAGNFFVFNKTEVDSVSFFKYKVETERYEKGYFFDCSAGVIAGSSNNNKSAPFMFSASFNYELTNRLYAGAGMGIEFWDESYMPVFLNINYLFRETRFTPFFGLQAGYLIGLEDASGYYSYGGYYDYLSSSIYPSNGGPLNSEGGFMINPQFGFQSMINPNLGWTFSFGYRFHKFNYSGENEYEKEYNFNRLTLKLGIIFN